MEEKQEEKGERELDPKIWSGLSVSYPDSFKSNCS